MINFPNETEEELIEYYGEPGTNQVRLILPYPMIITWLNNRQINSFYCHEKVKDTFESLFKSLLLEYGYEKLCEMKLNIYDGCFNFRYKRGGDTLSVHSWAAALDLGKEYNELKWDSTKALFARPEYDKMWKIVEDLWLYSLGRIKNYDWMHIQAAKPL